MKNEQINDNKEEMERPARPTSHRVLAWIGIVILVAMYGITLVSALSGGGSTSALFMMSLGSTILIPVMLWGYIRFWEFSMKRDRRTFGVNTGDEPEQESGDKESDIAARSSVSGQDVLVGIHDDVLSNEPDSEKES